MAIEKGFYGDKMLEKLPSEKKRGQGAVEYLLILAAVLVVVAVAVYYVIGVGKGPTIAGTATLDNDTLYFTPEEGLSPDPYTSDWEWSVWSNGTSVISWATSSTDLTVGNTITVSATAGAASVGDELRIKAEGKSYNFTILAE
jgi:hypothetical protein